MIFTADLSLPPSANNLFATFTDRKGNTRRIITREYKAWKRDAGRSLIDQWNAADRPAIGKPYQIYIRLNTNHQSDIANREKALTDLLVSTIPGFPDDAWMNRLVIERDRTVDGARIEAVTLPEAA